MKRFMRSAARLAGLASMMALSTTARAFAQSNASFPDTAAPPPTATPAPATPPPEPAPAPAAQSAPAATPNPAPPPPTYGNAPYAQQPAPAQPAYTEPPLPPPPPPEPDEADGFEMPPFSVRIDPFLWLLDGKLAFELEVALAKFLSVELVPLFVVNEQPPTFNYFTGREDPLSRESDGIGPLAGTSIGLGFWLNRKPLEGTVLRAIFTNYAYHYVAADEGGEFDNVSYVERHLLGYLGSHSTWGAFTLAGGFGLGANLNPQERCFRNDPPDYPATTQGCDGDVLVKVTRDAQYVDDVSNDLGGVVFLFRLSLGVTFD